jgi:hypothetical protein
VHYVPDAVVHHALGATYGRVSPRKIFLVERNHTWAALRSLPRASVCALPIWTGIRLATQAAGSAVGRGVGSGAGIRGVIAAIAGNGAAVAGARRALQKRREDQDAWTASDAAMRTHMRTHRARTSDILSA